MTKRIIDIKENSILEIDKTLLEVLLHDNTTRKNIIWATDDYSELGDDYKFFSEIKVESITGENGTIIRPRIEKNKEEKSQRSKSKAEVFTPSWICNTQNNLVDDAWFGKHVNRFNKEKGTTWESTYPRKNIKDKRDRIAFPKSLGKTWQDYVLAERLEVSCGEAPYLTSRYDTVTGNYIKPRNRIGLLDRKLRVIYENVSSPEEWLIWAEKALQSTYGFEWQGDNILLARENLLFAVMESFQTYYGKEIAGETLARFAEIISWNIWQMDGIKYVVPESCHTEEELQITLFEEKKINHECPGCKNCNNRLHNGIYSMIRDWKENKTLRFIDLTGGQNGEV